MLGKLLGLDPAKKLRKLYDNKLYQAMQAQRNGDIRKYSELTAEAEAVLQRIEELGRDIKG